MQSKVKTPWGPIGEVVFRRSYSRDKSDGTKETWPETVVRAVDGNIGLVDPKFIEPNEREKLIDLMLSFGIIPAGRHLYSSGVKGREFIFNCFSSGFVVEEPWEHFTFLFDALMQGGGVGTNYSNRYIETIPPISRSIDLHLFCRANHPDIAEFYELLSKHNGIHKTDFLMVEDSREGWVEAIRFILKRAWDSSTNDEAVITIDVSSIRPKGKKLNTSGGVACGPGPFILMLHDLVKHLNSCHKRKLTSLDVMTIDHTLASCVIAGGKRRSSRMSVKNWKDPDIFEFINCKRSDGAHWTTNISVETDSDFETNYRNENQWSRKVMRAVILGNRINGEPGIWNRTRSMEDERNPNNMYCPNPCGEIGLEMFEACNLGHINLQYFAERSPSKAIEAFRLMTRWLIRATFAEVNSSRQREVMSRNRRIGVGFFGFHGWLALQGIKYSESYKDPRILKALSSFRDEIDKEAIAYSIILEIPVPVKTTALAPTGTISLMPGVSSSAQAINAVWFKRLVRYSNLDNELSIKKQEGYTSYPDPDAKNTEIIEYWCEDPLVTILRNRGIDPTTILESQDQIPFESSLELQATLQDIYANNGISMTINLPEDKLPSEEDMEKAIMKVHSRLKGTTVFVDRSRQNAPIQRLTREQFDSYTGRKEVAQIEDECKNGCPIK